MKRYDLKWWDVSWRAGIVFVILCGLERLTNGEWGLPSRDMFTFVMLFCFMLEYYEEKRKVK